MLVPEWGDPTIKIGEFVQSEKVVVFCLASPKAVCSFVIPCVASKNCFVPMTET
jgi:hypothetical protein